MVQETTADPDLEEEVGSLLEKLGEDKDLEWAREQYDEKMEDVEEKLTRDVDDDQKQKYAIGLLRSEISQKVNLGEVSEAEVITLGYNSPLPFDTPVFRAHGIIIPEDGPAGIGHVRMARDEVTNVGLTFGDLKDLFGDPYQMVRVHGQLSDAGTVKGAKVIELETDDSGVEAIEPTFSDEKRRQLVSDHVDEVTLQTIGTNLSARQEDNRYPADFGIDLRVIRDAYFADIQVGDDAAKVVLQDDTVVDPDQLDESIRGDDIGMTCWMEKEICQYGAGTVADVFGVTKTSEDGQVLMNITAVDPIMPVELEQDVDTSDDTSSQDRSTNATERTI